MTSTKKGLFMSSQCSDMDYITVKNVDGASVTTIIIYRFAKNNWDKLFVNPIISTKETYIYYDNTCVSKEICEIKIQGLYVTEDNMVSKK